LEKLKTVNGIFGDSILWLHHPPSLSNLALFYAFKNQIFFEKVFFIDLSCVSVLPFSGAKCMTVKSKIPPGLATSLFNCS